MTDKLEFIEFEVKFKVDGSLVYDFKKLAQTLPELSEFIYLESDDIYYVKGDEFIRHRFDPKNLQGRQELTYKRKRDSNNIYRTENNVRCDGNSIESVAAFCNNLGFARNFKISKYVHIYRFPEVTLPFYTVIDENGQMTHFMEIEINEDNLHGLTEDQCWEIISKWEKILAPLGVTPQKRMKRSLFELYRKQVN
jgi:predicted adenylyl cyclase CyaB